MRSLIFAFHLKRKPFAANVHSVRSGRVFVGSSISAGDESFLYLAKENNIKTVEINPKKTDYSHEFDLSIRRTAKDVLGMLVDFSLLLEK